MTITAESWLQDLSTTQTGMRKGLVVRGRSGERMQVLGVWPLGSKPDDILLSIAADAIGGKYPIEQAVATADGMGKAFPLPVRMANRILGAVVIEVGDSPAVNDEALFANLHRQLATRESTLGLGALAGIGPGEILSLQATLLSHRRFAPAATALATELAGLLHCDRVSIGLVQNGATRLEAVSHSSSERHGGDDFMALTAAMDECVDQQATILFPQPSQSQPRITLAHANLARRDGGGALLTLPLVDQLVLFGAITFESMRGTGFEAEEVAKLEHMMGLIGPLLAVKREADMPLWRRLKNSATSVWRKLTGPGHATVKAATAGVVLIAGLLTLLPVDYRITAPVRLEGQVQRILSAPSQGFLEAVHARPGDRVQADQVLVELARQELLLELRRWQSDRAEHENAYG
ncbi:MAG: GAF domain-containing protein, partial [Burkholderiaceae bacterium]|nr:GAF domain-containing protein [Burkholderiaceae bacterium]